MSLRIALLGLLTASGPASGYDLAKYFETSLNHVWQAGHSQIYPELNKMTADGLVTVEAEGARGRKIYAITPEGSAQLRTWLVEHAPSGTVRSESGLQAFLLPLLDKAEAILVLERFRAQYASRLKQLESLAPHRPAGDTARPDFGKYALDLGLRQMRSTVQWADDTLAELRGD